MESKTVIKNDKPKNIEETVKVLIKQISALNNRVSALEKENINLKTKLSIFEKYLTPQINDQIKLKEKILTDIITNINELDVINKRLLRQNKRTVYTLIYKAKQQGMEIKHKLFIQCAIHTIIQLF